METPIQEIINLSKSFNVRRDMLVPHIVGNRVSLLDNEKKFIKKVYKDALADSDLSEAQKEVKAETYYSLNYADNK